MNIIHAQGRDLPSPLGAVRNSKRLKAHTTATKRRCVASSTCNQIESCRASTLLYRQRAENQGIPTPTPSLQGNRESLRIGRGGQRMATLRSMRHLKLVKRPAAHACIGCATDSLLPYHSLTGRHDEKTTNLLPRGVKDQTRVEQNKTQ